jgi:sulfite exporter TauE/SafE
MASYHAGRWVTYLILGAGMGAIGSMADGLSVSAGLTPIAARIVGGMMIAMGIVRLLQWLRGSSGRVTHSKFWGVWNQFLIRLRKGWRIRSPHGAAFSWGLISTWLPCGWLYVFAIAAAGTGGIVSGMLLMTAFWIGTLPLLSLVSLGASMVGTSVQRFVQPATALLLIGFGIFTASSRAEIDLMKLHVPAAAPSADVSETKAPLAELLEQDLPCCKQDAEPTVDGD